VGWVVLTEASFLFSLVAWVVSVSWSVVLLGGELVWFFAGSVVVLIVPSFLVPVILSVLGLFVGFRFVTLMLVVLGMLWCFCSGCFVLCVVVRFLFILFVLFLFNQRLGDK